MSTELARNIVEQGAARLDAATTLATAADLRSVTLMGIFGASAVGVGGAVFGYAVTDHSSTAVVLAGAITAIGLLVSSVLAGWTTRPTDFHVAGGDPVLLRDWAWTKGGHWRSELEMLEATALRYAASIRADEEVLRSGTALIRASLLVALASPLVGVAVFVGVRL